MNEQKLKSAFNRIKEDMNFLKNELIDLRKSKGRAKKSDFKEEFEKLNSEIISLKDKLKKIGSTNANDHLDVELLDSRFKDFKDIISKRVDSEIDSLKFKVSEDLEKVQKDIISVKKDLSRENISFVDIDKKIQNTFNKFTELIDEKLALEINAMKIEFTEEIAKLYDNFFNEIVELKDEINKTEIKTTKTKQKNIKKDEGKKELDKKIEKLKLEETETKKKESKLKKVAKWLFVDEDEDEDEFENIKEQIKKE